MSVLALEVFAPSREHLLPDPDKDAIAALFYCFQNEDDLLEDTTDQPGYHAGYVVIADHRTDAHRAKLDGVPCHYVDSELDLLNWVVDTVREWDPDVLTGWELHNSSWGYLASRAMAELSESASLSKMLTGGYDLCDLMSRVRTSTNIGGRNSVYDATHTTNFKVSGRHVLNIWRILRSEINLTSYSFENVVFQVLRQRYIRMKHEMLLTIERRGFRRKA
jgi:DNA polymerase zeta